MHKRTSVWKRLFWYSLQLKATRPQADATFYGGMPCSEEGVQSKGLWQVTDIVGNCPATLPTTEEAVAQGCPPLDSLWPLRESVSGDSPVAKGEGPVRQRQGCTRSLGRESNQWPGRWQC